MESHEPVTRRRPLEATVIALGLAVLVAAVYWPVGGHGFVDYDDRLYVLDAPMVLRGLTAEGIAWAFRSLDAANWHPLTWLSHMLDVQLFGLAAGWHHRVSVLLHAVNAVLLFAWLRAATGSTWRSALAAALFAVHPLRVESVAWVAERKDLLCGLFWLLAMWAHLGYARRPSPARYLLVALAFAGALMSKAMAVTLPVVLLLLDLWPLRRRQPVVRLVLEKFPLLAMSAAVSLVTVLAQSEKALSSADQLRLGPRVENAVVSAAAYLWRSAWPTDLAVLYPHPAWQPGGLAPGLVAGSALLLAAISALAGWQWRQRPFLAVGWLWYLVALLPVIGLVQVGAQGMADRYTYLPLVGVAFAVAWSLPPPPPLPRGGQVAVASLAAAAVAALAVTARHQVGYWRDTRTLFERAVSVTRGNWQAWEILGGDYLAGGRVNDALGAFRRAAELRPADPAMWKNLAAAQSRAGDRSGAAASLERAVRVAPRDLDAWYSLAVAYAWLEQPARIAELVERLRAVDPGLAGQLADRLRRPEDGPAGGTQQGR